MERARPPGPRAGGRARRRADPQSRPRHRRARSPPAARPPRPRSAAGRRHHRRAADRDPARRAALVPGAAGGIPRSGDVRRQLRGADLVLDGFLAERGIAWERAVIGGFSMGAVMSYAVALGEGRPSPAAILAFSGFVPTVEGWHPAFDGPGGPAGADPSRPPRSDHRGRIRPPRPGSAVRWGSRRRLRRDRRRALAAAGGHRPRGGVGRRSPRGPGAGAGLRLALS